MARARAVKALYAVLVTWLLAAPAPAPGPAVTAPSAAPRAGRPPAAAPAAPPAPAPAPAPASAPAPVPAPPPAPTPAPPLRPRTPGVRGLEIAVPAYAWASDPVLVGLTDTGPAVSVVVLNPGNGDAPFDASWRAHADALRAGTTATGEKTKVLGYVHTDHGNRDPAAVKASVDNYLKPPATPTAASTSTASSSTSSAATAAPATPPATGTPNCAATSRTRCTPPTPPPPTSS